MILSRLDKLVLLSLYVCVRKSHGYWVHSISKLHVPKQQATPQATRQGISEHSWPSMIRARLIRSIPAISKSNRFPVVLSCYLIATRLFRNPTHYSKSFSTDSPVGPFVGSDGHIVRVVNRKGNTCRQARVHWLLASLVGWGTINVMSRCDTKLTPRRRGRMVRALGSWPEGSEFGSCSQQFEIQGPAP